MNTLLNWFAVKRWHMSVSHCPEALLIQIPVGLLFNFWIGALAVVLWYWSRKKLEAELEVLAPGESHAWTWSVGWFPWQWDKYMVLDVLLPAASSALLAWPLGHVGLMLYR